jgi:glycosyltransferase involved in cell wall biosynthesis
MLLGTDRTLFTAGSAVRRRLALLGESIDALDSIVFAKRSHGIRGTEELSTNVRAHPTNSFSRLLYGWDAIRIAKYLPRPDIVSAQDPFETGLAGLCIARYFGVPLSVEIHTDFLAKEYIRHSLLNRFRVLIAGFVLKRATGGYAVSDRIRDRVRDRYKAVPPLSLLPIYTDTKRFSEMKHSPHPRFATDLLWVGRMEREKDPFCALRAFAYARREGYEVGLTFVGSGSLEESLKEEVARRGLREVVEFTGNVSDVAPYYAHADLLLVTSAYEGYGMVIIEALASGVPVLSRDVGIAREAGASIAEKDFAQALTDWLKGSRPTASLKIDPYKDEAHYIGTVRDFYEALLR